MQSILSFEPYMLDLLAKLANVIQPHNDNECYAIVMRYFERIIGFIK